MNAFERYTTKQHLTEKLAGAFARGHARYLEKQKGSPLTEKDREHFRKKLQEAKKGSFALRHPVLTGLPTLGVAPVVALNRMEQEVIRERFHKKNSKKD